MILWMSLFPAYCLVSKILKEMYEQNQMLRVGTSDNYQQGFSRTSVLLAQAQVNKKVF